MSTSSSSSTSWMYGPELVTNGEFATGSSGWMISGGAYWSAGKVVCPSTGSQLKIILQEVPVLPGRHYRVQYDFTEASGVCTSSVAIGGTFVDHGNSTGTLVSSAAPTSVDPLEMFVTVASGSAAVTNVSVREILEESSSSRSSSSVSSSSPSTSSTAVMSTSSSSFSTSSSTRAGVTSSSQSSASTESSSSQSLSSQSTVNSSSSSQSVSSQSSGSSSTQALPSSQSSSTLSSSQSSQSSISSSSESSVSSSSDSTLSSSSESSASSSSESSRSSSSKSTSSVSSESSSSSTVRLTSSSSSSPSSGSSSSSSGARGSYSLRFTVEGLRRPIPYCFARLDGYVYVGTGPDGKVMRTNNHFSWEDFCNVGDATARSMCAWRQGLFVGTEPNGYIYVHNFTTGMGYRFVETQDQAVTAMCVYDDKLYAGTAPDGIVYSFDGVTWREEYRPYGGGVTAMAAWSDKLVVFMANAETGVTFDGKDWKLLPLDTDNAGRQTVASFMDATAYPAMPIGGTAVKGLPPTPARSVLSCGSSGSTIMLGTDTGNVLTLGGTSLSRLYHSDRGGVAAISILGEGVCLAGIGSCLYLLEEEEESQE